MGAKSRGNFLVGRCLRSDCANRGKLCGSCFKFGLYRPDASVDSIAIMEDNGEEK